MIRVFVKQGRGLVVLVATLAIAVAACGGSTGTSQPNGTGNNPTGTGSTANPDATGGLAAGLYANLDALDSYQFSWSASTSESGASATSAGSTSGVVINKPTKSYSVNYFGALFIQVGDQQWLSADGGATWMVNPSPTAASAWMPSGLYDTWFDTNSGDFNQVGTSENKNGVDCLHFQGGTALSALYGGVSGGVHSDLWIAKAGNYPVSGLFSYTISAGGSSGSFSYAFDITHVNDAANKVAAPSNVIVLPT
jgi:hypothetical protein